MQLSAYWFHTASAPPHFCQIAFLQHAQPGPCFDQQASSLHRVPASSWQVVALQQHQFYPSRPQLIECLFRLSCGKLHPPADQARLQADFISACPASPKQFVAL